MQREKFLPHKSLPCSPSEGHNSRTYFHISSLQLQIPIKIPGGKRNVLSQRKGSLFWGGKVTEDCSNTSEETLFTTSEEVSARVKFLSRTSGMCTYNRLSWGSAVEEVLAVQSIAQFMEMAPLSGVMEKGRYAEYYTYCRVRSDGG